LSSTTVPGQAGGHDLVPRQEAIRPLKQNPEHIERARADFDRSQRAIFSPPEQAAPVETELFEQKTIARGELCHASASLIPELYNILAQFRTF
jgi:hypothetical protein